MKSSDCPALVKRFSGVEAVVEVGIGRRTEVARGLVEAEVRVTATDVESRPVPDGVRFVIDDVTDPNPSVYEGAALVYALRSPPELHRAVRSIARRVGAAACLTTLGGEHPSVTARTETVGRTGLFWVHEPERVPVHESTRNETEPV